MASWRARFFGAVQDEVRPSVDKWLEAGTVLFRAGDHCHAVALIHEGEIELLVDRDGGLVREATRRRGTVVGDDEILGDGIWRRTARAVRSSRIEMLARDVYLERLAERSQRASATVSSRLVRLLPASPRSAAALPAAGIDITGFPFIVGRTSAAHDDTVGRRDALLLVDTPPYHLSRRQFLILREACDEIRLSDPGSRLGTFVDGRRLGTEPLPLRAGASAAIHAGGLHSPFCFQIRVD